MTTAQQVRAKRRRTPSQLENTRYPHSPTSVYKMANALTLTSPRFVLDKVCLPTSHSLLATNAFDRDIAPKQYRHNLNSALAPSLSYSLSFGSLQCRVLVNGENVTRCLLRPAAPSLHVHCTHNSQRDASRSSSDERHSVRRRIVVIFSRLKIYRLDAESCLLGSIF